MNEIAMKLRILFRAEMTLVKAEARRRGNMTLLAAISVGCVFIALVFVDLGLFFWLTQSAMHARAAFIVAGANLLLAAIPFLLRQRSKPGSEEQMVREIRDMAMDEVTKDVDALAQGVTALGDSFQQLKGGVASFAGGGLPALAPALTLVIDLRKKRKK